ncbi:hypothetical protein M758_9G165000 [Ceratodon purpureus]|nr:hypothetical protein M758_9G165000 [Ceratodon purpureus]
MPVHHLKRLPCSADHLDHVQLSFHISRLTVSEPELLLKLCCGQLCAWIGSLV